MILGREGARGCDGEGNKLTVITLAAAATAVRDLSPPLHSCRVLSLKLFVQNVAHRSGP